MKQPNFGNNSGLPSVQININPADILSAKPPQFAKPEPISSAGVLTPTNAGQNKDFSSGCAGKRTEKLQRKGSQTRAQAAKQYLAVNRPTVNRMTGGDESVNEMTMGSQTSAKKKRGRKNVESSKYMFESQKKIDEL